MMKNNILRLSLCVTGFLAGVIAVWSLFDRSKKLSVPDLLITCLASSDFMMGTYMVILAAVDVKYRDIYIEND